MISLQPPQTGPVWSRSCGLSRVDTPACVIAGFHPESQNIQDSYPDLCRRVVFPDCVFRESSFCVFFTSSSPTPRVPATGLSHPLWPRCRPAPCTLTRHPAGPVDQEKLGRGGVGVNPGPTPRLDAKRHVCLFPKTFLTALTNTKRHRCHATAPRRRSLCPNTEIHAGRVPANSSQTARSNPSVLVEHYFYHKLCFSHMNTHTHTHTHTCTSILVRTLFGIMHSLAPYPHRNAHNYMTMT